MFDDVFFVPPLVTSSVDHVPQQGNLLPQTTVSPHELFLGQHPHVPTQSYAIPHVDIASAGCSFAGYGPIDDTPQLLQHYPLAQTAQPTGHVTSGLFSGPNDIPVGHSTGPQMPIGRKSHKPSSRCEWVFEDLSICGHSITAGTVSRHLAEHGIRRMHKDLVIQCRWWGCGTYLRRGGMTRHAREVHLCLKRKPSRHAFVPDDHYRFAL